MSTASSGAISLERVITIISLLFGGFGLWYGYSAHKSDEILKRDTAIGIHDLLVEAVFDNGAVACGDNFKLRGKYLVKYQNILPLIEDVVPYPHNPCTLLKARPSPPRPPTSLDISIDFRNRWETWERFILEPAPEITLYFPEFTYSIGMSREFRGYILDYKKMLDEGKQPSGFITCIEENCYAQAVDDEVTITLTRTRTLELAPNNPDNTIKESQNP